MTTMSSRPQRRHRSDIAGGGVIPTLRLIDGGVTLIVRDEKLPRHPAKHPRALVLLCYKFARRAPAWVVWGGHSWLRAGFLSGSADAVGRFTGDALLTGLITAIHATRIERGPLL